MSSPPFPHPSGARPPVLPAQLVPEHIAIVMDGNGRWANARGLPRTKGHEAGEASLLDVVAGAIEIGVKNVSAYAFSTENWKRSPDEVRFLMGFNRDVIRRRRDILNDWGVRVRWMGRRPRLWRSVIKELEVAQELTANNTVMTLTMCVNYGGRAEIVDATRRIAQLVLDGRLNADHIDERTVSRHLDEPAMPVRAVLWRAADQQLSAVAVGLRRDGVPGHALARFRPARPVARHRDLRRS
jgi:undecaprenyl diphosphate synthase